MDGYLKCNECRRLYWPEFGHQCYRNLNHYTIVTRQDVVKTIGPDTSNASFIAYKNARAYLELKDKEFFALIKSNTICCYRIRTFKRVFRVGDVKTLKIRLGTR